jgi:periplasmic protein CpxP/Spy
VNHTSFLRALLVVSMFAAPAFMVAAQDTDADHSMPDGHNRHQGMNPVERAQQHLDELEQKLYLTADQQAAWKTYADTALARAADRAKHMEEFHAQRGDHHGDMDTASRLEHMSQRMRERADELQQMAKDTRAFQQTLTPEQQTIFDLYWKSQFQRGMRHGRK